MAQIICVDLAIGYETGTVADNINFSIDKGEYLYILGENGSGKTTLMKTLLGLTKPLGGQILTHDGLTRSEIGYLPQHTDVQKDFPASVREIVLSGFQGRMGMRPFYRRSEKETAAESMRMLDIEDLADKSYRDLSGGQQQRVLLARALCATRKAILLDEPVSGLDPKATREMYEIIARLNKTGITIIMISHDIEAAMAYASHILYIGKEIFYGTKEEFLESSAGSAFAGKEGEEA